jgi:hypothetical protein
MKRSLLPVLCLIAVVLPDPVFSETPVDQLAPRVPRALIWDKFDTAFKTILIGGLLVGYRAGIATGAASEQEQCFFDVLPSKLMLPARSNKCFIDNQ